MNTFTEAPLSPLLSAEEILHQYFVNETADPADDNRLPSTDFRYYHKMFPVVLRPPATSRPASVVTTAGSTMGIPDYSKDIVRLVHGLNEKLLAEVREAQRQSADECIEMDQPTFTSRYPNGKKLLFQVFTLAKKFMFDDKNYEWGGHRSQLTSADVAALHIYADRAIIVAVYLHQTEATQKRMPVDESVYHFTNHLALWTTSNMIAEVEKLRRHARPIVENEFGLSAANTKDENLAAYKKAMHPDNRSSLIAPITQIYTEFFLTEVRSVGIRFQKVYDSNPSLSVGWPGQVPLIPWSVLAPSRPYSLSQMATLHVLKEWSTGKFERTPYLSEDKCNANTFYQNYNNHPAQTDFIINLARQAHMNKINSIQFRTEVDRVTDDNTD